MCVFGQSWTKLNIGISRTIGGSVFAPLASCIPEGQSQQAVREGREGAGQQAVYELPYFI